MITVSLFFDKRTTKSNGESNFYIALGNRGIRTLIYTGVSVNPKDYDGTEIINRKDKKFLNQFLEDRLALAKRTILQLTMSGDLKDKSLNEVAKLIRCELDPEYKLNLDEELDKRKSFGLFYQKFCLTKINPGTRGVYECTLRKLRAYCLSVGKDLDRTSFKDITKEWLICFESFCQGTETTSTINIHLRNIRAAFNAALDEELCTNYPFRKYKIRQVQTRDKSFSSAELRQLFACKPNNRGEELAVDLFKLMFALIGINCIDLYQANKPIKGRLEYIRQKTGKPYSVKIQPEAEAIIKKYEGKDDLLELKAKYSNYKTLFHRAATSLKKIGLVTVPGKKSQGNALCGNICFGSARTSWATIAQEELDIPRDVIAAALGHHTIDVTSTYLRTNWSKKIDEANRKVLDLVFG